MTVSRASDRPVRSSRLFLWALLPLILLLAGYALHAHTTPAFDATVLRGVAEAARARFPPDGTQATLESTVDFISAGLARIYPKHIHPPTESERKRGAWVTNLAGGFKTSMLILHASLTEYVMIWGAALPTTGHSGRNLAQFHDYIISGEGKWWKEGQLGVLSASARNESTAYVHTDYLQGGIVHLTEGTFMLEYCRGVIPALLPFGLGDALFSSMDPVTLYRSITAYGRLTLMEILQNGKL